MGNRLKVFVAATMVPVLAQTVPLPETLTILGMVALGIWTLAQREAALKKDIEDLAKAIDERLDSCRNQIYEHRQSLALFQQASGTEDARISREVESLAGHQVSDRGRIVELRIRLDSLETWAETKGYHRRQNTGGWGGGDLG